MTISTVRRTRVQVCAAAILACSLALASLLYADTGTLTWNANTESDLQGYKVYRSTVSGQYGAPVATLGKVTTYNLDLPQLVIDTTYFVTLTAYDQAGNESTKSKEVSKLVKAAPTVSVPMPPVLSSSAATASTITVTFPPLSDGAGGPALLNLRYAIAPALTNFGWGSAGSAPCTSSPCVITGLSPDTLYEFQAVAYRVDGGNNVFSPLSTIVSRKTAPVVVVPPVDPPPAPPAGLIITKATSTEIIIQASAKDCQRILTSTTGTTKTTLRRTLRCTQ